MRGRITDGLTRRLLPVCKNGVCLNSSDSFAACETRIVVLRYPNRSSLKKVRDNTQILRRKKQA